MGQLQYSKGNMGFEKYESFLHCSCQSICWYTQNDLSVFINLFPKFPEWICIWCLSWTWYLSHCTQVVLYTSEAYSWTTCCLWTAQYIYYKQEFLGITSMSYHSSKLLLAFTSTDILASRSCWNTWPNFCMFQNHLRVWKFGHFFDERRG
jgi:hypothetical protein